jgi:hypothetical protein
MLGEEGEVSYEQLNLLEVATQKQTEVMHQQIYCGGLGAYGLAALCWFADSQLLYFTDARQGVPDGAGEWQRPLFQVDPATGQTQPYNGEVTSAGTAQALPVACQ